MDADWNTLLTAWTFKPFAAVLIGLMVALYYRGSRSEHLFESALRPQLFYFSLIVLFIALFSPIHRLASHFFFIRVTQHILLISVFVSSFMNSDPFVVMYAGLPKNFQPSADRLTERLYPILETYFTKGVCWFIFIFFVWVWYDFSIVDLTLAHPWLRNIELGTMLTGGMLHWWHVAAATPKLHPRLPAFAHMGYTLAGAGPLKVPGLFFLFAIKAFYAYPEAIFLGWEMDALANQRIGGIIIWMIGGTVYTINSMRYFSRWLDGETSKPPRPLSDWDTEEVFRAPHLE
ncbi:MAG: cytochrome c oxidase assembly protein [Anaerolineae bacterium]